jgi:hypothetical protein
VFSCKSACRSQSSRSTCSSAELHTAPHCTAPLRHCTACSAVPLQSVDRQTRIAPLCELSTGTRNPKPVPFLRCRPTHSRVNRCHGGLCGSRPTVLRVLCSSLPHSIPVEPQRDSNVLGCILCAALHRADRTAGAQPQQQSGEGKPRCKTQPVRLD